MQQLSCALAPLLEAVFCFLPEKYINTIILIYGEKLHQLHAIQRQLLQHINKFRNETFRNRENLHSLETVDSFKLSFLMRINGKCNSSHATQHRQAVFCFLPEANIP